MVRLSTTTTRSWMHHASLVYNSAITTGRCLSDYDSISLIFLSQGHNDSLPQSEIECTQPCGSQLAAISNEVHRCHI